MRTDITKHAVDRLIERHAPQEDFASATLLLEAEAPYADAITGPDREGVEHWHVGGTDLVLVARVDQAAGVATVLTSLDHREHGSPGGAARLVATARRVRRVLEAKGSNAALNLAAAETRARAEAEKTKRFEASLNAMPSKRALRVAMAALRALARRGDPIALRAMGDVGAIRIDYTHESFIDAPERPGA